MRHIFLSCQLPVPNKDKACQNRRGKSRFNRKAINGRFSDDEDDGKNKPRRKSATNRSCFENSFDESSSEDEDEISVKHQYR